MVKSTITTSSYKGVIDHEEREYEEARAAVIDAKWRGQGLFADEASATSPAKSGRVAVDTSFQLEGE